MNNICNFCSKEIFTFQLDFTLLIHLHLFLFFEIPPSIKFGFNRRFRENILIWFFWPVYWRSCTITLALILQFRLRAKYSNWSFFLWERFEKYLKRWHCTLVNTLLLAIFVPLLVLEVSKFLPPINPHVSQPLHPIPIHIPKDPLLFAKFQLFSWPKVSTESPSENH